MGFTRPVHAFRVTIRKRDGICSKREAIIGWQLETVEGCRAIGDWVLRM